MVMNGKSVEIQVVGTVGGENGGWWEWLVVGTAGGGCKRASFKIHLFQKRPLV